jgi:hypothetical protein
LIWGIQRHTDNIVILYAYFFQNKESGIKKILV